MAVEGDRNCEPSYHHMKNILGGTRREKMEIHIRRRINISTSVKGVKTFDCTVEGDNITLKALLKESDKLVKQLELRYPVIEVK